MRAATHAVAATGAFGRAPYTAAKHVNSVPNCAPSHMRSRLVGPSVGLPLGRDTYEGCPQVGAATHAAAAAEAFGGAPYVATKRAR
eukprot:1026156-Pyramimonas_sp.AAC.1